MTNDPDNSKSNAEAAKAAETAPAETNNDEDARAARWAVGVLCAGAAWLFGKAFEWLFGPSERSYWWKLVKFIYFTAVYGWAFCVLLAGVIQIYRLERGAGKKSGSVRPASAEPKVTDDSPSGVLGWCLIGLIWIVAMSILLAIIGFVLYGFYLVGMSWWDQYLDLFAEPPVR
jgi:hypothetical protein